MPWAAPSGQIAQILRGRDDGTGDRSGHRKGNSGKTQDDEKETEKKKEESGRNESDVNVGETGKRQYLDAESTELVPAIVARVMGQPRAGHTVEASHLDGPEAAKASTAGERTQAARDVTEGMTAKDTTGTAKDAADSPRDTAGTTHDTAGTTEGGSVAATYRAGIQVELPIHSHMDAWEYVRRAGLGDLKVHHGKAWNSWEGTDGRDDTKSGGKPEKATKKVGDEKPKKKKTQTEDEKAKQKGAAKKEKKQKEGKGGKIDVKRKSKDETKSKKEKGHKTKKIQKAKKFKEKKSKGEERRGEDKNSEKSKKKKET